METKKGRLRQEKEKTRGRTGAGAGGGGGWPEEGEKKSKTVREVRATERREQAAAGQGRTPPLPPPPTCLLECSGQSLLRGSGGGLVQAERVALCWSSGSVLATVLSHSIE